VGAAVDGEEPQVIEIELSEKGKKVYKTMAAQMIAEIEEMEDKRTITAEIVLTKILRLSQITSGFVKDTEGRVVEIDSVKVDTTMDLIEDMVEQGEKVVVFCRFIHDITSLQAKLDQRGIGHAVLRGGIKGSHREELINRFATDPTCQVFVSQIASGSLGIDLTAASLCIFLSWDYRWDTYRQAVDRLHRQGQTRHCTYYHIVVPRSIDTESLHILSEKGNLAEAIVHNPNILRPGFIRQK
jgi:SNF2 family DNA or RNA helicase